MNKEFVTNLVATSVVASSFFVSPTLSNHLFLTGSFALSGSLTNQIAIHMLFNRVPFLYGSGIIELKFKELKLAIKELILNEFFNKQRIEEFLKSEEKKINLSPLIEKFDFSSAFDALLGAVKESKLNSVLSLIGGSEALEGLREPFTKRLKGTILKIVESDEFKNELDNFLQSSSFSDDLLDKIDTIVQKRLDELSPKMVKDMLLKLMKEHLGWLVVWGGVFGGILGFISSFITH